MNTSKYAFMDELFSKVNLFKPVKEYCPDFQPRLQAKIKNDLPEGLRKAWELAVFEAEANIKDCPYGGKYFTAGGRGGWHNMLFGQDTVACGLLAFNRLYPDVMKNQIRTYVLARLNIGFMCPDGWLLRDFDRTLPLNMDVWQPNSRIFCERYNMSPCLNRTGQDVGWIWTAGDLFDICGDRMDWAWLFGMGELFFEYFYKPFYDETDGLYFGQASFIDVGINGYSFALQDMDAETQRNSAVRLKASSTNALYVRGMDVLSHAADILDRPEDSIKWKSRANELRNAMRRHLRLPDGTFSYMLNRDGTLEPRCEALGAAYCILADVVTGDEAKAALALGSLQFSKAGVSLFYPFYNENPKIYHNHSAWPFASTFYYLAKEKVTGESCMIEDAQQLFNVIHIPDKINANCIGSEDDYLTGTFREYAGWDQQEPRGTCAQSYSISAFMNLCLRNGWLDQEYPRSRFL